MFLMDFVASVCVLNETIKSSGFKLGSLEERSHDSYLQSCFWFNDSTMSCAETIRFTMISKALELMWIQK